MDEYKNGIANELNLPRLSLGYHKMNNLLDGGISRGEALEFYGESNSGKSQLCMMIAAEFARNRKDGSTVLYIDTKNDMFPDRLFAFTGRDPPSLRRIKVVRECKAERILDVLESYDEDLAFGQSNFLNNLRLVIIDCLPGIVYPQLSRGSTSGRCFQEELSQCVKKLGSQHGMAVVMVNNAVSVYERGTRFSEGPHRRFKPAVGKYWLQIPHFRIFLHRDMSFTSIVSAVLEKSTRCAIGNSFDFTINDEGIE